MHRIAPMMVMALLFATGCREIWIYQPTGAVPDVRDKSCYWTDLGEVDVGSGCPFVVAPWERGDEFTWVGFKIRNKTDEEMRIQRIHLRVGDLRIAPTMLVEDKSNGYRIPALGGSEFTAWISFPEEIANIPREFVLCFELATRDGVRRKEVTYAY